MIDICIVTFNRLNFSTECIEKIALRTRTPHRIIVVDNGSTDGTAEWIADTGIIDKKILLRENKGIHYAWNLALLHVKSDYFVCCDNDILCPDLRPVDWLGQLWDLIENYPQYAAISARPQVLVGEPGDMFDVDKPIVDRPHVGASLRIMRADAVRRAGGWEKTTRPERNHEERWICSRLKKLNFSVGYAKDIRCWHLFGDSNWGYKNVPHGHRDVWPPVEVWDSENFRAKFDPMTFEEM